jgi:hypothetical protein
MLRRVSCVVALLLISASASAQQPCTTDACHSANDFSERRYPLHHGPDVHNSTDVPAAAG